MAQLPKSIQVDGPKPFLRWAGSKRQILSVLSSYWRPSHRRYLEPFAGSACLFFRIQPKKAILGDINHELIHTYVEIKYRLNEVIKELSYLKKGRDEFLRLRNLNPMNITKAERAARFIYLNRFCFNGLYRTNLAGKFNVPYGGEKAGELPSSQQLKSCSRLLKSAKLVGGSFERVLTHARSGDFIYLDPPFSVEANRVFKEYNSAVFDWTELEILRTWLEILAKNKIDFLVSYAQSSEADFLRKDFFCKEISVRRNISGFASGRRESREVLISWRPITAS
jgi:DNA adenine methylase